MRKMKNKNGDYVAKSVVPLSAEEASGIPALNSIMKVFGETEDSMHIHSYYDCIFTVVGWDGELKDMNFRSMKFGKSALEDSFNDCCLVPVKMTYTNGDVGYGFKYFSDKPTIRRKHSKLRSLYVMDGVFDDDTGEVKGLDLSTLPGKDVRIPMWALKKMPMWNEKVMEKVKDMNSDPNSVVSKSKSFSFSFLQDMSAVGSIMSSDFVSSDVEYTLVKTKNGQVGIPMKHMFVKNNNRSYWPAYKTSFTDEDNVVINERGYVPYTVYSYPDGEEICELHEGQLIGFMNRFCYSYFKSIYDDDIDRRRKFHIIPLSNLLTIGKKRNKDDGEEVEELWNNLDQAVHGNL